MKDHLAIQNGIKSGIRFATAGIIAFIFYHWFDLQFGFWAVVTVAAVMRPNLNMTIQKCLLRLAGTVIGVAISYVSILILQRFPNLLYPVFFCALFITGLLIFADKKNNYMGIICGVTVIIIITTYQLTPAYFYNAIVDRTFDVIMGILIGWVCSNWLLPLHTEIPPSIEHLHFHIGSRQVIYAFSMAIATTISLLPWFSLHYTGGFWAPIACLMIIEETIETTQKKGLERFIAHGIVLFFTALLSFALSNDYGLGVALAIGLFIFGYLMENPIFGFSPAFANTLAIAYCIVLLYAPGQVNTIEVAMARFLNTMLGIAVGMVVVAVIHKERART